MRTDQYTDQLLHKSLLTVKYGKIFISVAKIQLIKRASYELLRLGSEAPIC